MASQHAAVLLVATMAFLLPPPTWMFSSSAFRIRESCSPRRAVGCSMARIQHASEITQERRSRHRYNKWPRMIRRLQKFHQEHGHSRVTARDDPQLHRWVQSIRSNYRHQTQSPQTSAENNKPRLSNEQLEALQKLDFSWNVQEDTWKMRYDQLCQFRAQHGHCLVPLQGELRPLAVWVRNQRRDYRYLLVGKNTTLTTERLEALQSIGFLDSVQTHQDVWDLRLQELTSFYRAYQHSNVPADYSENYSLGQWVMNQRTQYKRFLAGLSTSLTPSRIAALEGLDFRWNLNSYKWFAMLERLKQHQAQYGHLGQLEEDLQIWVTRQRHFYTRTMQNRTSPLSQKRIRALEEIPNFSWSGRSGDAGADGGPSVDDWAKLFEGIREKGIMPGMRPKQHWFEGQNRFQDEIKDTWTEEDLLELWNQEDDDGEDLGLEEEMDDSDDGI